MWVQLAIANATIGFCFLVVPMAALYLYVHRRRDWPKSWVLVSISFGMGTCGLARLTHAWVHIHWPDIDLHTMMYADYLAAGAALLDACLVPVAVYRIRQFPTPTEMKETAAKAATAQEMAKQAFIMAQQKERAERQSRLLLSIINQTPNLSEPLKQEVNDVIRELAK